MAGITVHNLDDEVKTWLRMQAADNGRLMGEDVRVILRKAAGHQPSSQTLWGAIRAHFGLENGVILKLPVRGVGREPPSFG